MQPQSSAIARFQELAITRLHGTVNVYSRIWPMQLCGRLVQLAYTRDWHIARVMIFTCQSEQQVDIRESDATGRSVLDSQVNEMERCVQESARMHRVWVKLQ